MKIANRDRDCPPFTTADGSTIRELLHTENQSLAEATLEPGQETQRHYHRVSEELYYLEAGEGEMELDGERRADRSRRRDPDPARRVAPDPRHGRGHAPLPVLLRAAVLARRHVLRVAPAPVRRLGRMTIAFARGAPAPECLPVQELADCAKAAIERDGVAMLSYGAGGGYGPLREWIAAAARRRARPGPAHERLAPGLRLPRPAPRRPRPARARRGADLRPAAADPRAPRRRDRAAADGRRGARPRRARARARARREARASSTRSRPSRTRAGGRSRPSGAAASPSSRPSARAARARGRPVRARPLRGRGAADAVRARGRRERRLLVVVLEDRRARASGSATSCCRPTSRRALEAVAVSTYISPPFLSEATVFEFIRRGNFEPNLVRVRGLLGARRDAMLAALEREFPAEARWSRPEGGYFLWLDLPAGVDARRAARRARPPPASRSSRARTSSPATGGESSRPSRLQLRVDRGDRRGDRDARRATCCCADAVARVAAPRAGRRRGRASG